LIQGIQVSALNPGLSRRCKGVLFRSTCFLGARFLRGIGMPLLF
jgi:hypothetical protein